MSPQLWEARREHTLPLGGLVNQRVQAFINGCFTLKLLGSWKTVTGSLSLYGTLPASPSFVPFMLPPSGEMGIVSRGTGS